MLESVRDKLGLLNRSIKLDRTEGKVRVSFEAERPGAAPKGAAAAPAASDAKHLRDELKALLNRCPGAREVLPHLAGVEQALKTQGLAAFDSLPPRVLQRAATQLESVLAEPVSAAIAELRSRLCVALKNHEKAELAASRRAAPSSFLVDEKLQVSEASVSDFMKVMEESKQRP
jgi:hypothetical protein